MKRSNLLLLFCIFISIFLITGVFAQEGVGTNTDAVDVSNDDTESTDQIIDISTIDETAQLQETEGITPDSALYFFDEFLDRFGDDLNIREEKIAEIKAMIQQGKIEEAKIALQNYLGHAETLEREVSPEESEEARRSAAAIYNTLQDIENEIPDEEKEEFFDDIIEREGRIVTASEIAGKIKELCEQLSRLDPLEYSRVCKTNDGSPEWQQRLHKDLTEEQKQEAEAFFEIMSQCFETSGRECRCEDISVTAFAEQCSIIAPLATACDEGDESACEAMDEIEDPIELLPDYLQDVMEQLERRFSEDRFEHFAPKECRDAGATSPRECMKIMFRLNAPEECVEALENGEIDLDNEREARESCERIMFELNAPEECIEQGLTDFRECGQLMFRLHAPQECTDAGLTGESRGDEKKCRLIMESQGRGPGERGPPALGIRCRQIENPEERLRCYDSALGEFEHSGFSEERRAVSGNWPQQCREANALTPESCEQVMREWGEQQRQQFEGQPSSCQSGQTLVCDSSGNCRCEGEFSGEFIQPEEFTPPQCADGESLVCDESGCRCVSQGTGTTDTTTSGTLGTTPTTNSDTTIGTGAVINDFYRYYFG